MTGRVKVIHDTYGFIVGDDLVNYFYHIADEVDDWDLMIGDRVNFIPAEPVPAKGPRAKAVAHGG